MRTTNHHDSMWQRDVDLEIERLMDATTCPDNDDDAQRVHADLVARAERNVLASYRRRDKVLVESTTYVPTEWCDVCQRNHGIEPRPCERDE